jgi:hypothetical protein
MSKKGKVVFFSIAGDDTNLGYAQMMVNSFRHFYPDIPMIIIGQKEVQATRDPHFYYRATPIIANQLLDHYELVVKIDADSLVVGNLDHILEDETYDMGNVLNWNRVDPGKYPFPLTVWDIPDTEYMNCGFVAMRSKELVEHWLKLCFDDKFLHYRFREQDLMNIIYYYGNYNVKCFDHGNKWHGLISVGEWMNLKMKGDELVLPVVDNYPNEEKTIKVLHVAGGQVPDKMNLHKRFKGEVLEHLIKLASGAYEQKAPKA